MAQSSSPTSWFSRLRGRTSSAQTDWADLGTAYGLDQSMRSTQAPAEAKPAAPVQQPHAPRAWWNRLGGNGSGH